jgi:preprotein translocase subunit SecG
MDKLNTIIIIINILLFINTIRLTILLKRKSQSFQEKMQILDQIINHERVRQQ